VSVVAYIDGSQFSESIILHASWASRQLGVPVLLVHLLEEAVDIEVLDEEYFSAGRFTPPEPDYSGHRTASRTASTDATEDARALLIEVARAIRSRGVEQVRTHVDYGPIEDHVREHAQDASLIVLGKRGERSSWKRGDVGSHLEGALRASRSPVLIAPSEPQEIRRFLFAFDGSPHSGDAVRYLAENPLLKDCPGTLLLAGDRPEIQQQLHDAASRLRRAGYDVQEEVVRGNPENVILDILNAEEIDLLVMGAFGHSRIREILGGSTTLRLLRSSAKAILAVR
jgi:nucleotide-binding universal stress UspA family protein